VDQEIEMFVRAVWRNQSQPRGHRPLKGGAMPTVQDAGVLGLGGGDFAKMTRDLFGR
jgi:hypothetical protein